MTNILSKITILVACAGIGISLAFNSTAAANAGSGAIKTPIEHNRLAIELIGMSDTVALGMKGDNSDQIPELWQRFNDLKALHESIRWAKSVSLYAYYTDFNATLTQAKLMIGYDVTQLNRSVSVKKLTETSPALSHSSLESGQYQYYAVQGTTADALYKAWADLHLTRKPHAVLEHYQLDQQGKILSIQLEVKYN